MCSKKEVMKIEQFGGNTFEVDLGELKDQDLGIHEIRVHEIGLDEPWDSARPRIFKIIREELASGRGLCIVGHVSPEDRFMRKLEGVRVSGATDPYFLRFLDPSQDISAQIREVLEQFLPPVEEEERGTEELEESTVLTA